MAVSCRSVYYEFVFCWTFFEVYATQYLGVVLFYFVQVEVMAVCMGVNLNCSQDHYSRMKVCLCGSLLKQLWIYNCGVVPCRNTP